MVLSLLPKEEYKPSFKGLAPKVPNAYNALCPALNFGVEKYMTWSKHSCWSFNTMQMEKKVAMILRSLQTIDMWVFPLIVDTSQCH